MHVADGRERQGLLQRLLIQCAASAATATSCDLAGIAVAVPSEPKKVLSLELNKNIREKAEHIAKNKQNMFP
jgi:hypothetical protein